MNSNLKFIEYHYKSINHPGVSVNSEDTWPEEWLRIYFKSYPRFEEILLPQPSLQSKRTLTEIMKSRESSREFDSLRPMTIQQLSNLLSGLMITRENNNVLYESRRPYPSAGARYPLEVYVLPFNIDGLDRHVLHYSPRNHSVERLWRFSDTQISSCFPHDAWCSQSGAAIIITACYHRSAIKYGERAYRFCTLEAGHAAQNLCLLATNENLEACPYGGYVDEEIMRLVDINPNEELPLNAVIVGNRR